MAHDGVYGADPLLRQGGGTRHQLHADSAATANMEEHAVGIPPRPGRLVGWPLGPSRTRRRGLARPRHPNSVQAVRLTGFTALSFDCYGTLIDWEAGLCAVLGPCARTRGLDLGDEALLNAYSRQETRAEAERPDEPYPAILARSMRGLGRELGAEPGWGATPPPTAAVAPDWEFPSMKALAEAVTAEAGLV